MSVINKMLRDLDLRANVPAVSSAPQPPARSTVRGTPDVTDRSGGTARRGRYPLALLVGLLVGLAVAGVGWWVGLGGAHKVPPEVRIVPAAVPALIQPAVVQPVQPVQAASVPGLVVPGQPSRTDTAAATGAMPAGPAANIARVLPAAVQAVPTGVPLAGAPRASVALAAEGDQAPVPGTKIPQAQRPQGVARYAPPVQASPVPPSPVAPSVPVPVPVFAEARVAPAAGVQWQDAALQAVAQAQQLWNSGLNDSAINLLKESLLVLERAHGAELAGPGSTVALALVRELVRMELAQGQPDAALALLKRHERLVSGQADLLASRGNAAQRIGQHAQASQSYQAALKLRPGEPRWMLGAAISLAAMGQLAAAAELVEQARGLDAIKPDVLTYLKQLGVPLRER